LSSLRYFTYQKFMYCYILVLLCTTFVVKADNQQDFADKIDSCGDFYNLLGYDTPNKNDPAGLQGYIAFVNMVNAHNANSESSYVAEVNCWSTIQSPLPQMAVRENDSEEPIVGANEGDSPDEYDRRDDNTTTDARSQGSCGSCWAFAAIASLESRYLVLTGDSSADVDFSEQQILDCTYESNADQDGCQGGWMTPAWSRLQRVEMSILYTETQRPYTKKDGVCDILTLNKPNAMRKVVMSYPAYQQKGDTGITYPMGGATQERIWLDGAVSIAIRVENAFQSYKEGLFNTACTAAGVNHALTFIGYTQEAFIAQNSWGKFWGVAGTVKLSRASNLCEMLTYTMWPKMECAWGKNTDGYCVAKEPCGGCKNNGRCQQSTTGSWSCNCLDGFEGDKCDTEEDPCNGVDCGANGQCSGGKCECGTGWSGDKCEKEDGSCTDRLDCSDMGQCREGKCQCDTGASGDKCEKHVCDDVDCGDYGQCLKDGKCYCDKGWSGDRCENEDDKACTKKCKFNKECFWKTEQKMSCRCPSGSYGRKCDKKVDCDSGKSDEWCEKRANKWGKEKWTRKCGMKWGMRKCPNLCGYCA